MQPQPLEKIDRRGVSTWPETTKKAQALDEIIRVIADYLSPESNTLPEEVLTEIIGIIETKTGHRLLEVNVIGG